MKRVKELEKQIRYHKALYYAGSPEISDFDYDKLEDELRELSPDNPVLNLIGSEIKSEDKVKHDSKMLSLGKTYSLDELMKWAEGQDVVCIYKVDGVSCSLIYENGRLVQAKTRGDGQFGENITSKVNWMKDVPLTISSTERIEIRGEMYCDEKSFISLCEEMTNMGLDRPTSQRNIVAGLVGRKENISLCKHLSFAAFDVIGIDYKLELEKYKFLNDNGFNALSVSHPKTKNDYSNLIEDAKQFMSEGDFLIDGLVFVYNSIGLQNELGETAHHPRYKMAFKFQGETKQTTLLDITWQVSRNGYLTPVGEVEPVEISNAIVSRVTLHNYGIVANHKLKKGDVIEIVRSGEVIPKFLEVKKASNNDFVVPSCCPSCNQAVTVEDIRLVCKNKSCPAQIKEVILNFVQKIGIEALSSKRLDEILRQEMISGIEDLYKLTIEDFLKLDKVKDKLAQKFFDEIQKSKRTNLITFLASLGISGGAVNKCEKVVTSGYETIDKILTMRVEDLIAIEGFAEKSASEFIKSLNEKKLLIKKLIELGFEFEEIEKNDAEGPLKDMKVCITGALSQKRSVVEEKIKKLGGSCVGSVSKNTSILLTNETEPSSSKYKKAIELGIRIISEEELFKF
ncbi:NAD-dependent DNA ligase LigA [Bacteriovorax sp. Seq25_V]|uniref:NAD-dependent DNA ligase LigA n=1 Tax=Bacteriovorax sp. Seq25_V TaxID=1201288 RepID=UPI000389E805|nr:NAD-dependent DNA ligase LigA [Bacteriovorax sp. Seq25_V]EQC43477.1 DNA ligase (NAD+) [Bacteriovorax sp. Seq25_V]